ncbi:MAG: hypothetical protein QNJ74_28815 [Trichodesmium sp. MO_231.B1]|nr:hypothetical protein [Trichodesmium sp. MO_231.B1]
MVKKRCDPATTTVASGQTPRRRQSQGNADQDRERAPRDRKLSRSISDLGWRQFRKLLEGKTEKYGRVLRVIRSCPLGRVCVNPMVNIYRKFKFFFLPLSILAS